MKLRHCLFSLASVTTALSGCGGSGGGSADAAADAAVAASLDLAGMAGDAQSSPPFDVTGTWATRFGVAVTADYGNGRVEQSSAAVLAMWNMLEAQGGSPHKLDAVWLPCALPIPGLGVLPYKSLEAFQVRSDDGAVTDADDGESLAQPSATLIIGAYLSQPDSAPLPDGNVLCSGDLTNDCVVPDERSGLPGAAIVTQGLTPDADNVFVVARFKFAAGALAHPDGSVGGHVASASLETRVLACHLRGGGTCAPSDVAKIQAAMPKVTLAGDALVGHTQGLYFTCPQFLDDPQGAVSGTEVLDGGAGDLGTWDAGSRGDR